MRANRNPLVSTYLDTRAPRAYIHGMAITPNGRGRDMLTMDTTTALALEAEAVKVAA